MFTRAAAGQRNSSGPRRRRARRPLRALDSRVRGLPEFYGELPVACWPRRSRRRARARCARWSPSPATRSSRPPTASASSRGRGLDFMLAIDIYVNETTRHADVILPAPEPLESRTTTSPLPARRAQRRELLARGPRARARPAEWEIFMRLAGSCRAGPNGDPAAFDDLVIQTLIQREVGTDGSPSPGASRPSCSRRSSRGRGPSACSTSCSAPGRTATASARTRRG